MGSRGVGDFYFVVLEALYGFLGALLGALAGAGCSLMGSGVGMTMH